MKLELQFKKLLICRLTGNVFSNRNLIVFQIIKDKFTEHIVCMKKISLYQQYVGKNIINNIRKIGWNNIWKLGYKIPLSKRVLKLSQNIKSTKMMIWF